MSNQLSLELGNQSITELHEKFHGAFIGAAVGDALGFTTEFVRNSSDLRKMLEVERLTRFLDWERVTRYQQKYTLKLPIPAGTYSDDTQLTLATARSIEADGSFNVENFSKLELSVWLHYQLGGGTGTKLAAKNLAKKNVNWYSNFYHTSYTDYVDSGGNGVAMRILPIALVNINNPTRRYLDIWRSAIATHGHVRALMGAILMTDAVISLLKKPAGKLAWLADLITTCNDVYPRLPEVWMKDANFGEWQTLWNERSKKTFQQAWLDVCEETKAQLQQLHVIGNEIKESSPRRILAQLGCYDRNTKGAGNSTVVAAIFFLCHSDKFEHAILSVVNEFGIDTDTIGYFVGAMFGAYYGLEGIPSHFQQNILDRSYLLKMADWCHQVYSQTPNWESGFKYPNPKEVKISESTNTIIKYINEKPNKVYVELPVLGSGKIQENRNITPSWDGKNIYWLQILLDMGQTIFLQITRSQNNAAKSPSLQHPLPYSSAAQEKNVVSALAVLDQYKSQIENHNFDPSVIVESIRKIKFEKQDRAIYNAFITWLWAALPKRD